MFARQTYRRPTLGIGSTPKFERRLHLREIFNGLDKDYSGTISIAELHACIQQSNALKDFFRKVHPDEGSLFDAMDLNGDGAITWDEFMTFLSQAENGLSVEIPQDKGGIPYFRGRLRLARDDKSLQLSMEPVKMVLEVLLDGEGIMATKLVDTDAFQAPLNPMKHITVSSMTSEVEINDIVADFVESRAFEAKHEETLTKKIRAAVIKASQKEQRFVDINKKKLQKRLSELARQLITSEGARIAQQEIAKECISATDESTKSIRQSTTLEAVEEIENEVYSLNEQGCTTPRHLAAKLNQLQMDLQKTKAALEVASQRPSYESKKESIPRADEFNAADTDQDGVLSRTEWVLWSQKKMEIMRRANEQRIHLIKENTHLRNALSFSMNLPSNPAKAKNEGGEEKCEDLLKKLDSMRLANLNLQQETKLVERDIAELEKEIESAKDEYAENLKHNFDTFSNRSPGYERELIMKNWNDEKDGVLKIHERARQEWNTDKANLLTQQRELQREMTGH